MPVLLTQKGFSILPLEFKGFMDYLERTHQLDVGVDTVTPQHDLWILVVSAGTRIEAFDSPSFRNCLAISLVGETYPFTFYLRPISEDRPDIYSVGFPPLTYDHEKGKWVIDERKKAEIAGVAAAIKCDPDRDCRIDETPSNSSTAR